MECQTSSRDIFGIFATFEFFDIFATFTPSISLAVHRPMSVTEPIPDGPPAVFLSNSVLAFPPPPSFTDRLRYSTPEDLPNQSNA